MKKFESEMTTTEHIEFDDDLEKSFRDIKRTPMNSKKDYRSKVNKKR